MVHSETRSSVVFQGQGAMWILTKIIRWFFYPVPSKLEKEVADCKRLVRQIRGRIERNKKRLEEMRKDKGKLKGE